MKLANALSSLVIVSVIVTSLGGCNGPAAGRMTFVTVPSEAEHKDMGYGVYVPPGWDGKTKLPLVLLLHGAGDDERTPDREVVMTALDGAITRGEIPPFIMVTPRGERGFWLNWYDGSHKYKDWVLQEAVPAVRASYPTIDGPQGLHLMGVSMGGGGGMQMWLSDPSQFASATIISAPILNEVDTRKFLERFLPKRVMNRAFGPPGGGGGHDPYTTLRTGTDLAGSRLTFGAAKRDMGGIAKSNAAYHSHLVERQVPHRYVEFDGRHSWDSWAPMFVDALCHNLQETCPVASPPGWMVAAQ